LKKENKSTAKVCTVSYFAGMQVQINILNKNNKVTSYSNKFLATTMNFQNCRNKKN